MHSERRARPGAENEAALYTPAAADFSGIRENTLYKWRLLTDRTGVQHGPQFARDDKGRPFYTRGWLLDFRRKQALDVATKAQRARKARK